MTSRTPPLPDLAPDDDTVIFREPWEAESFALAVQLHEQGLFTWREWTEMVGEEIQAAQAAGDPDLGDTYFSHWTRALARIVADKTAVTTQEIDARTDEWHRAYLATPHGQPVELSAAEAR